MKRFFQVVEKDSDKALKKAKENEKEEENENENETNKEEPLKFVTWNANSLFLRVKNNWSEFSNFITTFDPDVIAIQEVRMPAAASGSQSKSAPKNQGEIKDDTNSAREEKRILMRALSNPPFGNYRVWWSLADSKYAGTALFVKKCFKPKSVVFNLDKIASKHEPDGRVILIEFETFRLLNTYVPNNGWKEEANSFQRRRKWDNRILEFVHQNSDKPLIWCGDLNVSHEEIDVSHPEFFSTAKQNGYVPPNKEDCGQPGFTLAERARFGTILREGKLVDAYRFLHKNKDMEQGFSWSGNPIGRYRGKRMRIDYFLVSEKLEEKIVACEMRGQGIELKGFYGSDHCPVTLELSPCSNSQNEDPI
ncbi:unnamed protein product [Lathyrus sativus]|nr:unnamed protein product [Lathyrus sativus]